tara:strand:- start:374 stop:703 length:330 start_codon:yes stop_codon:yes gene_type:complete
MGLLKNIKDGWSNYIRAYHDYDSLNPMIRDLAESRGSICKECPELTPSGLFTVVEQLLPTGKNKTIQRKFNPSVDDSDEARQAYKCGKCGCAFPANVFAEGKRCPIGKW